MGDTVLSPSSSAIGSLEISVINGGGGIGGGRVDTADAAAARAAIAGGVGYSRAGLSSMPVESSPYTRFICLRFRNIKKKTTARTARMTTTIGTTILTMRIPLELPLEDEGEAAVVPIKPPLMEVLVRSLPTPAASVPPCLDARLVIAASEAAPS